MRVAATSVLLAVLCLAPTVLSTHGAVVTKPYTGWGEFYESGQTCVPTQACLSKPCEPVSPRNAQPSYPGALPVKPQLPEEPSLNLQGYGGACAAIPAGARHVSIQALDDNGDAPLLWVTFWLTRGTTGAAEYLGNAGTVCGAKQNIPVTEVGSKVATDVHVIVQDPATAIVDGCPGSTAPSGAVSFEFH